MSYRCGIGGDPPRVRCDYVGCTAVHVVKGRGVGSVPPAWLLDGKAPPRWRIVREGDCRSDYCPEHPKGTP